MTNKKLKTSSMSAQSQRSVGQADQPRIVGTGRTKSTSTLANAEPRKLIKVEVPDDMNMDVLADKIAARMRSAELASNASIQGQNLSGAGLAIPTSLVQRSSELTTKMTPIDGALVDLQANVTELESQLGLLIQAIEPVMLYDYDEKAEAAGMCVSSVSPMHSRIIGLTSQVKELAERIERTRNRVQL